MATISITIDDLDLWGSVWGSGFESDPVTRNYLTKVEYLGEANWDTLGTVRLTYVSQHDDDVTETKDITVDDLAKALTLAITEGYQHSPCGGAITTDTDEWDACVADLLIQLALYGEEVWA